MKLPKNFGKMIEGGDVEAIRLTDNEILKSIIKTWRKTHQGQRFGQWLINAIRFNASDRIIDETNLFDYLWNIYDEDLIKLIEGEK
jgi:hypothetical protein